MLRVFRIEDKDGNGPYFYKNGVFKSNPYIISKDRYLSAFSDICRFFEPSYINFYKDSNYILYEIIISKYLCNINKQVIFDPHDILYKVIINKPKFNYK